MDREIGGSTAGGRRSQAVGAWSVDILIDGEMGGDRDIATPRILPVLF